VEPIRTLDVRAFRVPTEVPEADGTLQWSATTIIVVRVHVADVVGLGWSYSHGSCVPLIRSVLAPLVVGRDVLDTPSVWQSMQRAVRNLGRPGLVSCAMSAVDIAMWDAAARIVGLPLCRFLGQVKRSVPVYGSGGFTNYDNDQLSDQIRGWLASGLTRIKIKIGADRGTAAERDLARTTLARAVAGDSTELYVDANGAYSVGQAIRVGDRLAGLGVTWFEEPVSSDDRDGLRRVRDAVAADVAAGEYGYHLPDFAALVPVVDCLQVDVTRCGGYGEWLRVAALAAAHQREVSGHCAQNVTVHVAAATPNVRHLEWFHDHDRIERLLFDGVLVPAGGTVSPDMSAPGNGLSLKEVDAQRYRIDPGTGG
jgi:L-alanine-DL-glutamate epimerase-like enolase superfamily enzyme